VLVRADMDGLPIEERSGLDYASKATQVDQSGREVPVMHACGHDTHMTALVGTARRLDALRDEWQGTVMFIGQPAEERIGGAKAMLADGLYERFGVPDYALALHVWAAGPAGRFALGAGPTASSSDSVDVKVLGIGSHGAAPQHGKDPIYIAAQIVIALQGFIGREINPLEPAVITVGSIHGGLKHNVIPDEVDLELTVRADSEETREQLLEGIARIAEGVARTAGLPESMWPQVKVVESTPSNYNDEALTARVIEAFLRELGEDALFEMDRDSMGAEDFAEFVRTKHGVPGTYFSVGGAPQEAIDAARTGGPPLPFHHSPYFKVENPRRQQNESPRRDRAPRALPRPARGELTRLDDDDPPYGRPAVDQPGGLRLGWGVRARLEPEEPNEIPQSRRQPRDHLLRRRLRRSHPVRGAPRLRHVRGRSRSQLPAASIPAAVGRPGAARGSRSA
jgi:hippurate hydrolase